MKKYLLTFLAGFIVGTILITYLTNSNASAEAVSSHEDNVIVIKKDEAPESKDKFPERTEAASKLVDAPYIYQMNEYPNGCESVSAVMALRYSGVDISVDAFIDELLPKGPRPKVGGIGPDPAEVYCGDPRSPFGWGCYSSVIADVFGKCGYSYDHSYTATLEELCRKYIDKDIPVIIWATVNMEDSRGNNAYWYTEGGKRIEYNKKLHCLLLVGYDEEYYYFNDPMLEKNTAYKKKACDIAFEILGNQSIAVF